VRYDFCVVGGGIVGLATAREILQRRPGASLVLLEKETDLAAHQTGHNSGVIHAGVYYAPGSLKARLCHAGNRETKQFCAEHDIPIENCGKLIVATTPIEVQRLDDLKKRSELNEIAVHEVAGAELSTLEPHITGLAALLVPSTGIVDYRRVSRAFAEDIEKQGGEVRLRSCVSSITESGAEVEVELSHGEVIRTGRLIACGGLQADRLAHSAGLDVRLRIIPFRGEYFQLPPDQSNIVRHLIYPVPDPELPFLGVHLTRTINGRVTVGPNAVLGFAREGYPHFSFNLRDTADTLTFPGFWRVLRKHWRSAIGELGGSLLRGRYLQQCRKYCPELTLQDLLPYPAGIRAQAVLGDGTLVHDFMFADTPRTVHVLNAPSPAATAALPIARVIAARVLSEPE
jgi:(S)-2-hydroxyglutarate dehydrogenase